MITILEQIKNKSNIKRIYKAKDLGGEERIYFEIKRVDPITGEYVVGERSSIRISSLDRKAVNNKDFKALKKLVKEHVL